MKQVLLHARTGDLHVEDVPPPSVRENGILVRTDASLISSGTERAVVQFAQQGLVGKARERPDQVRRMLKKVRTDGIAQTVRQVRNKLDAMQPVGYSAAGTIIEVGQLAVGFRIGDRVACAGAGYAAHAEVLSVPTTLVAKVPAGLSQEEAAFGTVGAIALQGVRLAQPEFGDTACVIGLGLIGLITVQILRAHGCRVIAIDIAPARLDLAKLLGADAVAVPADAAALVASMTAQRGVDRALITASTSSNEPVRLAGQLSRSKGRVIVVGAVGLTIPRNEYYRKELEFAVSMSYGPGRYDSHYEEQAHDYPYGYVRWTAGRNIASFLDAVARGSVDLKPLITETVNVTDAPGAYRRITGPDGGRTIGVVLRYTNLPKAPAIHVPKRSPKPGAVGVGVIGAGGFAQSTIFPILSADKRVDLRAVTSRSGLSAAQAARTYGFARVTERAEDLLDASDVDTVFIATQHDSHARLAVQALRANKNVFLEKPLAITPEQMEDVRAALAVSKAILTVGFNRRFSPYAVDARTFMADSSPVSAIYRVNAGVIPADHWVHDPTVGGGRIIGEGCHFIDLLSYLLDALPREVFSVAASDPNRPGGGEDIAHITIRFDTGAVGTIAYLSAGTRSYGKEHVEIFGSDRVVRISDFAEVKLLSGDSVKQVGKKQSKGHKELITAFISSVQRGETPPISYESLFATTDATFAAVRSMRTGEPQPIGDVTR